MFLAPGVGDHFSDLPVPSTVAHTRRMGKSFLKTECKVFAAEPEARNYFFYKKCKIPENRRKSPKITFSFTLSIPIYPRKVIGDACAQHDETTRALLK